MYMTENKEALTYVKTMFHLDEKLLINLIVDN